MRWAVLLLVAGCAYAPDRVAPDNPSNPDAAVDPDANLGEDAPIDGLSPTGPPFLLSGTDWLLPCTPGTNGNPNPTACRCTTGLTTRTVGGVTGDRWHVTVRIR